MLQDHSSIPFWTALGDRNTIGQSTELLRRFNGRSRSGSLAPVGQEVANPAEITNLFVVPYYRGHSRNNMPLPYHWAVFAATGPEDKGTIYQLRGTLGNSRYSSPEKSISLSHSRRKRQEMSIGKPSTNKVREMEAIIAQTPISTSAFGYNCQNWVENVLERMCPHKWLYYQPSTIVALLKRIENELISLDAGHRETIRDNCLRDHRESESDSGAPLALCLRPKLSLIMDVALWLAYCHPGMLHFSSS